MKNLNILVSVHLDKKNYFKWGIDYYVKYFDKIKIFYILSIILSKSTQNYTLIYNSDIINSIKNLLK